MIDGAEWPSFLDFKKPRNVYGNQNLSNYGNLMVQFCQCLSSHSVIFDAICKLRLKY